MKNYLDIQPSSGTESNTFPNILGVLPNDIIDSLATRLGALAVISAVIKEIDTFGISLIALYLVGLLILLIIYPVLFRCMDITISYEHGENKPKKSKVYILQLGIISMMIAAPVIYIPSFHKLADLITTPLGSITFTVIILITIGIAWIAHRKKETTDITNTVGPNTEN